MEAARTCRHCQGDWRRQEEHDHDPDAPSKSQRRLRPCSGCRTVWYCCALHRRRDWIEHVFACKPDELTAAHYLVRAVQTGVMPDHLQTNQDYGFSRCPLPMQKEYLFGMYSDFIKVVHMGHPYPLEMNLLNPEKLHDWRVQGLLVVKIKAAFDALPPSFRGAYYSWFLQNQHILNTYTPSVPQQDRVGETRQSLEMSLRRAWIFAGGSPSYSDAEIHHFLTEKDVCEANCILLYAHLFCGARPARQHPLWIHFGFCACANAAQESTLAQLYVMLAERHAFSVIYVAWSTSKLDHMFRQECAISPAFAAFFSTLPQDVATLLARLPSANHSVWNLKKFISSYGDDIHIVPTSMLQDYGFINCRTSGDVEVLRHAYRRYFDSDWCQPLRLHEACIQGRLFQHIHGVVCLKNKKLHALMRNCYPAYGRHQAGMALNSGFYDLAGSRIDQTGTDAKPSSIGVKLALVMIGVVLAAMLLQNWLTS
ncbi:hypothetical protein BKA62DRAFT_709511 [Auriculariales sp. MPI-PUGE-AT-0066]|nr:hypothetical protein BKA62DRAFT_709511 [Auriculariales sp. MPI-PUGE-AT-0066]